MVDTLPEGYASVCIGSKLVAAALGGKLTLALPKIAKQKTHGDGGQKTA